MEAVSCNHCLISVYRQAYRFFSPLKANPDYKGKWYAPQIDNPAYKGEWAPRKIPNPGYFEDLTPVKSLSKIVRKQYTLLLVDMLIKFVNRVALVLNSGR